MAKDPWVEHVRAAVKRPGSLQREHNLVGSIPPERLTRRGKTRSRLLRVLQLRADVLGRTREQ